MAKPAVNKNNLMQKNFVDLYVINGNASGSYAEAYGCTIQSAYNRGPKLLTKPHIIQMIKLKRDEMARISNISKAELIEDIIQIKNDNKKSNPFAALKAADQLAKLLGFNAPTETRQEILFKEQPLFSPPLQILSPDEPKQLD